MKESERDGKRTEETGKPPRVRRPYRAPALQDYGRIARTTLGGSGANSEMANPADPKKHP